MPETIYDVAIIGSGPGGYTAAIRGGEYGLKVALIEKDPKLGGTCLHVGCIPTKSLLFDAEIYDHFKAAKEHGIENVDGMKVNWGTVQDRKNKIVTKHAKGLEFLMRKNKVTVVPGYGRLTGPVKNGVLEVEVTGDDGKKSMLHTRNVILASGSQARMLPGLKPDPTILTNIEILSLGTIPKSLIVIGSGAVGVEFASIYKSYGAEVTAQYWLTSRWHVHAGYTELRVHIWPNPGSTDTSRGASESHAPDRQFLLRSSVDLPGHLGLAAAFRAIDDITNQQVPAYAELNATLTWQPLSRLDLSLVGQNLLHSRHAEFGTPATRRSIERGVYGTIAWRF